MAYTVLGKPQGSSAFDVGAGGQFAEVAGKALERFGDIKSKRDQNEEIQKAVAGKGLEPEFKVDSEGNVTTTYKTPKTQTLKESISATLGFKDFDAEQIRSASETDSTFRAAAGIKTSKESRTAEIESAISEAQAGTKTWDQAIKQYPLDADKIKEARYATLNDATRETIEDIGNQPEAYESFLEVEEEMRLAGVDVDAIKEIHKDLGSPKAAKGGKFDWTNILAGPVGIGKSIAKGLTNG